MKRKIALVSVTLNAVNPMTDFLNQQEESMEIRNYLDSYLLQKVREDGGINDSSMKRMFQMLATACEDGADGIILTCTIFSPYVNHFAELLSKPVICPDGAMLDCVAQNRGKTAILCTFEGTVNTTREMYFMYCRKYQRPESVDMYVLSDAYEAMQRERFIECNSIIQNKVMELDEQYDQIVLAQISMSQAADGMKLKHAKLFTSPDSAYRAVIEAMQERG